MKITLRLTPYQMELLDILLEDACKTNKRKVKDGGAYERRLKEYTEMRKQIEPKLYGA